MFVEYDEIERFMCGLPDGGSSLRAIELSTMYNDCMWNYERLAPQLRVGFLRAMAARFAPLVESGEFPFEELEPWKRADLNAILESPEAFNKRRWRFGEGRRGKAMHYLFTCGPAMALRIAKYKRGA